MMCASCSVPTRIHHAMPKGMCWRKREERNEGIHKSASAPSVADIKDRCLCCVSMLTSICRLRAEKKERQAINSFDGIGKMRPLITQATMSFPFSARLKKCKCKCHFFPSPQKWAKAFKFSPRPDDFNELFNRWMNYSVYSTTAAFLFRIQWSCKSFSRFMRFLRTNWDRQLRPIRH